MEDNHLEFIKQQFKIAIIEKVELIQPLWSDYGELNRVYFHNTSVIVKLIKTGAAKNHPRGWNTDIGHHRKVKSYEVEAHWYANWAQRTNNLCRIPQMKAIAELDEDVLIVLEDLNASGYSLRKSYLSFNETKLGLKWLANFHALFMSEAPTDLWEIGTYWHLDTRPEEYSRMEEGSLKQLAKKIDDQLNDCQYKTIVHGDAKVANFCFNETMTDIAAVDFQYVGGGCGMKDVIYFISSCMSETECEAHEKDILDVYFNELEIALGKLNNKLNFNKLQSEWKAMYNLAWADFMRFLAGWAPSHSKVNTYSNRIVQEVISSLS